MKCFLFAMYQEYSKDGELLLEGQYNDDNKKTGIWKEYYKSGKILAEESYKSGELHGIYKSFHPNGNLWSYGNYENGYKEGKFEIFSTQGILIIIQYYNKDKLVGQEKFNK